jgi:hypothetical protein
MASIRQVKNRPGWRAVVTLGRDPATGRPVQVAKSFTTKRDAAAWAAATEAQRGAALAKRLAERAEADPAYAGAPAPHMAFWTVFVEAAAPGPAIADDALWRFASALQSFSGSATGSTPGKTRYGAQVSVTAEGPLEAAVRGVGVFRSAAEAARLPEVPLVRVDAAAEIIEPRISGDPTGAPP